MLPLLLLATLPPNGEIFGDVKAGDGYLAGAAIQMVCGTETVTAKTDSLGSFRLRAKAGGKCHFTVTWKGAPVGTDVVVFDQPTRYRFIVEEKDGKATLKRV